MKRLIFISILLLPFIVKGQNPHDSCVVVYKSDNLIEIVKPLLPLVAKEATKSVKEGVQSEAWIDSEPYKKLKNGIIKIYDIYYNLIEREIYRDSIKIIEEEYKDGKIFSQLCFIPNDTIYIHTHYYEDGSPKVQNNTSSKLETTIEWYRNGQTESKCRKEPNMEKCEYWQSDGLYKKGVIKEYKKDKLVSEVEVDKNGTVIRKIK